MTGTELGGRYRVGKALGEGGMGRVYEAHDRELGRQVAVKLLRDPLSDPAMSARFLREARAAAALTHPNACSLFELGEHEGQPFLVMELLHGGTAPRVCRAERCRSRRRWRSCSRS